jgi:phosphohistidine swiveling domain-containing protein
VSDGLILPLDAAGCVLGVAGGKGASLSTLARAGFPVPGGFIVTTEAYRAYVAAHNLTGFILATVNTVPSGDPSALGVASRAIRSRFTVDLLPPGLAAALCEAYAELGRPPVAVRSSGTAEDLPEASFAGQQDTYLNVVGEKDLLTAVVNCWGSLWTARAIGYRGRNDIPHRDVALAVVVQGMIDSEASGVLFTANPLDGKRTEYVAEATLGLGEGLVSGQVEPDRYVLEAATGRVLSKTLGAKALVVQAKPEGGTTQRVVDAPSRQALPDSAIGELVQLGRRVTELLGCPQDVEWAWADERIHLLQARPITSLFPLPAGMAPDPLRVLFSLATVQGLIDPITPLGQDALKAVFAGVAGLFGYQLTLHTQPTLHTAAGRLFINLTGLVRHPRLRHPLRMFLGVVEPGTNQALERLWDDPRLAPTGRLPLGTVVRLLRLVLVVLTRLVRALLRPDREREWLLREMEVRAAIFQGRVAALSSLAERLALIRQVLDGALRFVLPHFVPRFGAGMASMNLIGQVATRSLDEEWDIWALTRGMPHNVTTEMDLALWGTAVAIKDDPPSLARFQGAPPEALAADYLAGRLPEAAQSGLGRFLERYGMRGPGEIDLGRRRWREDPAPVMQVLGSYLRISEPDQMPDAVLSRGAASAEAALDRLVEGLRATCGGRLKARLVRWAWGRMRALVGLRELPKFWAIRMMGITRAALLECGAELAAVGLGRPEDLAFLHLDELEAVAAGEGRDWATLVEERRRAHVREGKRVQIPRLLLSDGQAFYEGVSADVAEEEGVLVGGPVSPGVVEGTVRVVLDPYDAQLEPGEILVCPGTDPAWTPLFLAAAGLVTEVGGLMTHGSVVAREYGIPAVVGVHQATARLATGQRVQVDGTAGRVILL